MKILLGSKSPRRQELLRQLDIEFTVVSTDCDESYPASLRAEEIPLYIAKEKAAAYMPQLQADELLITADTIVWLDGEVLGKPKDEAEAGEMLRRLSGKTHQVYTGVCMTTCSKQVSFTDCTDVTFRELKEDETEYYVSHYRPLDKAGAYGIQEWIGLRACTSIRGSYFNVMGLPVHRISSLLSDFQK